MSTLPLYILQHQDGVPLDPEGFLIRIPKAAQYMWAHDDEGTVALACISEELENYFRRPLRDWRANLTDHCYIVAVDSKIEKEDALIVHVKFVTWARITNVIKSATSVAPLISVTYDILPPTFGVQEFEAINGLKMSIQKLIEDDRVKATARLLTAMESEQEDPDSFVATVANQVIDNRTDRLRFIESDDLISKVGIVMESCLSTIKKKKYKGKPEHNSLVDTLPPPAPTLKPETLQAKLARLPLTAEARTKIDRDVKKLSNTPDGTAEYANTLDYLHWVAELPWNIQTQQQIELSTFMDHLNKTHYSLLEAKQHLVEHMALERMVGKSFGNVMCLVGGPGTGKTTIAKSIAAACNRKIIKIPLGGLYDDAELRGMRRAYIGSRPGRLIVGLRDCGANDPVILLDEIDKLARAQRGGDLTSTLLEILDPEQNQNFVDRYLEFGFDLSKAMFICTANEHALIPPALLDRVELIHFRDYTEPERHTIIVDFVIPKYTTQYCMEQYKIEWSPKVLKALAAQKGIRKAEELVKKLFRMAALHILTTDTKTLTIDEAFAGRIMDIKVATAVGFS